ncbi:hypothetical protein QZH41_005750 [Actinostola sp. cb2023]|nr:hypothetical protein QZH41_005750 [Actinostola sp. cb2023]
MPIILSIALGVVLLLQASTGQDEAPEISFADFCTHFNDLRTSPTNMSPVTRDLIVIANTLRSRDIIPSGQSAVNYALDNLCIEPSTYSNPECLYARRYRITVHTSNWRRLPSGNGIPGIYVDLWLLHPLLRGCLEQLNKPSADNDAKTRLLAGLAGANVADFAEILKKSSHRNVIREEIKKSCEKENGDEIFCPDLLDMIKLVDAFETVKDESRTGVKWNAYRLYFAMIKHNNPAGEYGDVFPSVQQSNELIVLNLEQIFDYINNRQVEELTNMMIVVPVKSSRSGCENVLSLPSSTKNACMFWKSIIQIRAYLQSTVPLGNGQVKKILNTNIDYPTFLGLTEMDRILSVVQDQENALRNLVEWLNSEIQKNTYDRFKGLRTYFEKVESFNREKSKADVDFITGRLNNYKSDVTTLSNDLARDLGRILKYAILAVSLEIAEDLAQLVLAGAVVMNPLEKIFGGSSVGDFVDRTATLAHTMTQAGKLARASIIFEDIRTRTDDISTKFQNNANFLENVNLLILSIGKETTTAQFDTRRQKFLTDYTAYNPEVRRPELTAMITTYGNLVDACCDVILDTHSALGATVKAGIVSSGLCPNTKELAEKMFETFAEIYDFQFDLIEAMATYMRAVTSQYAALDIVADYEELSTSQDQDVVNDLKTLSLVAYISYKTNIWEITESYCDILTYKEGGHRPSVCEGTDSNIARLASHSSPTCRNIEAYKDVPISSTTDEAFMDLSDLYAGRSVTFKIPNADWLVTNQWIGAQDRDSAIVVKKFEVFLPTQSATQHMVRVDAKMTGENRLSTSGDTSYVIVPGRRFVFEYLEGSGQRCRKESQALTNPYGTTLPKLCPLNVDENNCQELLEKTPLFPSVYSRWKVSISGYESTTAPDPTSADFKLKVGVKLCILSPRSRDKAAKTKKKGNKIKKWLKSKNKNKLEDQERKSCPTDRYWSKKAGRCAKCHKGSRSALGGYFCEKIPKKN